MGNSVFSRRWLGNSPRFRPRLEHLERRVLLAADVMMVAPEVLSRIDLPPQLNAAETVDQTVLQRTILVKDDHFLASLSVLASPSVSNTDQVDRVLEIIAVDDGAFIRHTQSLAPSDRLAQDSSPPSAKPPTAELTTSTGIATSRFNRSPVSPSGQVVATRYSTDLTSDSINFSANEISHADLEDLEPAFTPAAGMHAIELPEAVTAAPLPPHDAEDSVDLELADDDPAATGVDSPLPLTAFPQSAFSGSLFQSPRCVPAPIRPAPQTPVDANSQMPQESCAANPTGSDEAAAKREPHERLACRLMQTVSKTKLLANLQEYAWMDVLVGAPIGRLSVLNGFDVFHELQTETPTDETVPPNAKLVDAFHCGLLMVGFSAAGIVMLRSNLSRKRDEAKDLVFGSSIHLDETLDP